MKKLAVFIGIFVVLSCGTGAWATLTMNFDDQTVNTSITNQYAGIGIHWALGTSGQQVTLGSTFAQKFDPVDANTPNILYHLDNGSTVTLDKLASSLSFDWRRPAVTGTLTVSFYSTSTSTSPFLTETQTWTTGSPWDHFSYNATGASGDFMKFSMSCVDTTPKAAKFVSDNYRINPVPIPGAIFLFAPGLAGLVAIRRRFKK